jgi:hypothetical protein
VGVCEAEENACEAGEAMICPHCKTLQASRNSNRRGKRRRVIVRSEAHPLGMLRRRECQVCKKRFTTIESVYEETMKNDAWRARKSARMEATTKRRGELIAIALASGEGKGEQS